MLNTKYIAFEIANKQSLNIKTIVNFESRLKRTPPICPNRPCAYFWHRITPNHMGLAPACAAASLMAADTPLQVLSTTTPSTRRINTAHLTAVPPPRRAVTWLTAATKRRSSSVVHGCGPDSIRCRGHLAKNVQRITFICLDTWRRRGSRRKLTIKKERYKEKK